MSTISSDRSTVRTHGREVVVVMHKALSRDMLISYINFIRQYMHLEPLAESAVLDAHAQKKAHALKRRSTKVQNLRVLKKTQPQRSLTKRRLQSPAEAFSPFGETPEYLSCVLDHNCDSVGIYVSELPQGGQEACTVQVFGIKN